MADTGTSKPRKKALKSETQLQSFEKTHSTYIIVGLKYATAVVSTLVVIAIISVVTFYTYKTPSVMKEITNQVFNNIGSIAVGAGIFLGLKKQKNN